MFGCFTDLEAARVGQLEQGLQRVQEARVEAERQVTAAVESHGESMEEARLAQDALHERIDGAAKQQAEAQLGPSPRARPALCGAHS